ncbi:MAG TPA: hypothetical protein VM901_01210 [Bdellovibrionota bacterium]|jgi:hypothetical protein|nr:hypothetical protein [Bdellovibrionota bacterium]
MRQLSLLALLTSVVAQALGAGAAEPRDIACQKYFAAVAETLSRADVAWDHPLESLKASSGSSETPAWLTSMEDELVQIFTEVPPELRNWDTIQKRLHLSDGEMWDLRTYYGLNIFNYEGVVDAKSELIGHARKRAQAEFLRSSHPAAKRYPYYVEHLGKKSVPEMAEQLGLREGDVYHDLSILNLSLARTFDRGEMLEGSSAEAFAKHHAGIESRSVEWSRILEFRGVRRTETEVLVELLDEGLSYNSIADQLNALAGRNVSDTDVRTEASVASKVQTMGLTQNYRIGATEVSITPYGLVKSSGRLVPLAATEFLLDHREENLSWLAAQLGVLEVSLLRFIERQHIDPLLKHTTQKGPQASITSTRPLLDEKEAAAIRARFAENLVFMDRLIEHLAKDGVNEIPPTTRSKTSGQGAKRTPLDDMMGMRSDRFLGNASKGNLNPSRLVAFENTLERLKSHHKLPEPIRSKVEKILTEELKILRFEALDVAAKRILLEDRLIKHLARDEVLTIPYTTIPKGSKISPLDEALGMRADRFTGRATTGNFNPSRLVAMENTLERLKSHQELPETTHAKIEKILKEEIESLKFENLDDLAKRIIVEDRLIKHLAKEEVDSIPSTTNDKKTLRSHLDEVLGINFERFTGKSNRSNLNPSRLVAIENTLERLKSHKDLPETARTKVEKILKDEIESLKFESLDHLAQRTTLEDRLIKYLAQDEVKAIPSTTTDNEGLRTSLDDVLGMRHDRFTGRAKVGNLNPSRLAAMENTLVRLKSHEELSEITRAKVEKILKDEIDAIKFDNLDVTAKRHILEDRLITHLAGDGVNAFPSSSARNRRRVPLDEVLGIPHTRFVGTAQRGILNPSRLVAIENTLERLKSQKDLLDAVRSKVEKILKGEIESLKFENLSEVEKRIILEDRLIEHLAKDEVMGIPSTKPDKQGLRPSLDDVLGIRSARFTGRDDAGKLNPSRLVAMKNTLERLKSHSKLNLEVQEKIRQILENEIAKLSSKP